MRRRREGRKEKSRSFKRGTKVKSKNMRSSIMRGGWRL